MKNLIFSLLLIFIVSIGCDNNDPSDEVNSEAVGQYNMTMMDGMTVPDTFIDGGGNELILAGGELVIRDDGTYFLEIAIVVNDIDESLNVSNNYSLSGTVLMLDGIGTGTYDGNDKVDLMYPIAGISHVFTYDKSSVFE